MAALVFSAPLTPSCVPDNGYRHVCTSRRPDPTGAPSIIPKPCFLKRLTCCRLLAEVLKKRGGHGVFWECCGSCFGGIRQSTDKHRNMVYSVTQRVDMAEMTSFPSHQQFVLTFLSSYSKCIWADSADETSRE